MCNNKVSKGVKYYNICLYTVHIFYIVIQHTYRLTHYCILCTLSYNILKQVIIITI